MSGLAASIGLAQDPIQNIAPSQLTGILMVQKSF